ncbi:YesL family protein [Bacillus sp. OTU530]|uniref:YesL family protein n=1 Tax=Bacillus sp. OTU530 TaxID=3043862 RepID=UPI00313D5948
MEGFIGGIYRVSEWVMRFMYVNILWILFTLLGLVVLGFFPATTALFAVVRKWVMKQDIPVFNTFWTVYRSEFLKSNSMGLIITIFGCFLYFNIKIVEAVTIPILKLLYVPNIIIIIIFLFVLLYIFPVLVHFDVGIKGIIKNAVILMTINPIVTFIMAVLTGFFCFILFHFPGLIPFFSGSVPAFLLMFFSNYVFKKFHQNQSGDNVRGEV